MSLTEQRKRDGRKRKGGITESRGTATLLLRRAKGYLANQSVESRELKVFASPEKREETVVKEKGLKEALKKRVHHHF